jgi:hypothetical protein
MHGSPFEHRSHFGSRYVNGSCFQQAFLFSPDFLGLRALGLSALGLSLCFYLTERVYLTDSMAKPCHGTYGAALCDIAKPCQNFPMYVCNNDGHPRAGANLDLCDTGEGG